MTKKIIITPEVILERFLSKIGTNQPVDKCWEWKSNKLNGYGHIEIGNKYGGRYYRELAHRFSYRHFHKQEIPKGMMVCHICDNPPCCNPAHLFLGTAKDNVHDALNKKRWGTPEDRSRRAKKAYTSRQPRINQFGQFMKEGEDPTVYKGHKSEGEQHSQVMKKVAPKGTRHYASKFNEESIDKVFELRSKGLTYKEIASIYGVDFTCIYKIIKRKRWKHI